MPSFNCKKFLFTAKIGDCLILRYKFENQNNNKTKEEAYKKAGDQRKIKSEVSFMDNYIPRKFPYPFELSRQLKNKP
jgi:hypothetical protein